MRNILRVWLRAPHTVKSRLLGHFHTTRRLFLLEGVVRYTEVAKNLALFQIFYLTQDEMFYRSHPLSYTPSSDGKRFMKAGTHRKVNFNVGVSSSLTQKRTTCALRALTYFLIGG